MINWTSAKSLFVVVGTAALLAGCGFEPATGDTRNETVSYDLDDAKAARVGIRMGGGELHVSSGTAKLMEGTFAYNVPEWKPVVDYKPGSGELTLSQPNNSASFGNSVNKWDVALNRDLPMEITADVTAGEANMELGGMNLRGVDVAIGAGEVKMDLRGEPTHDYTVRIRGGVGETTVYLPKDAGIAATATKGIGDISTVGLEQRDGVWINPERVSAPVTVRLDVKGGVGQIRLVR